MDPSGLQRLFGELKRRKVFRAAGAYLVMAWVAIEVAGTVAPMLALPAWVPRLVLLLVVLGFPIAVGLAWAVDITDEGVRRDTAVGVVADAPPRPSARVTRVAAGVLVGIGVLAAALTGVWYLVGSGPGSAAITDRTIAVLPFETLGADETSAFTEGVHSGILTRLSNVADLDVISRTSVMAYRSAAVPVRQIAEELGVAWVVRGEVQELDERVLVNARLVDAREDRSVWADEYGSELTAENVFQIQSQIATAIIGELEARLTAGEELRVDRAPTRSLEAYRLYVQGRSHLDARTEAEMRRSLEFFRQAIARDSSYALAWVGLADALGLLHDYGHETSDATLAAAEEAVDRALELDPRSAEAYASRGLLAAARRQGGSGVRELRRAVELRPSYAEAHNWLAWLHLTMGDEDRALTRAQRAVELDPLSPEAVSNLVLAYLAQGRLRDALVEAERVRQLAPTFGTGQLYQALVLYELGRLDEAKALVRDLSVPWAGSGPAVTLALAHVAAGDTVEARAMMETFEAAGDPFAVGLVHAALGDVDGAFAAFDRVERWSEYWPALASHHLYRDALVPMRADPRYDEVLRRLDRAWNTTP